VFNPVVCCEHCAATEGCEHWTIRRYRCDTQGHDPTFMGRCTDGVCTLYTGAVTDLPCEHCLSGTPSADLPPMKMMATQTFRLPAFNTNRMPVMRKAYRRGRGLFKRLFGGGGVFGRRLAEDDHPPGRTGSIWDRLFGGNPPPPPPIAKTPPLAAAADRVHTEEGGGGSDSKLRRRSQVSAWATPSAAEPATSFSSFPALHMVEPLAAEDQPIGAAATAAAAAAGEEELGPTGGGAGNGGPGVPPPDEGEQPPPGGPSAWGRAEPSAWGGGGGVGEGASAMEPPSPPPSGISSWLFPPSPPKPLRETGGQEAPATSSRHNQPPSKPKPSGGFFGGVRFGSGGGSGRHFAGPWKGGAGAKKRFYHAPLHGPSVFKGMAGLGRPAGVGEGDGYGTEASPSPSSSGNNGPSAWVAAPAKSEAGPEEPPPLKPLMPAQPMTHRGVHLAAYTVYSRRFPAGRVCLGGNLPPAAARTGPGSPVLAPVGAVLLPRHPSDRHAGEHIPEQARDGVPDEA
jgi:hypothetical protein